MLKLVTVFILIFVLGVVSTSPIFADNLLINSSFEDITGGIPNNWTKNVSTATLGISSTVKEGTASASINKTNSSTGTIYLYQDVDIEPESYYSLSGYALKNSANFSWLVLRISWRNASSELSKTDSSRITSDATSFQSLNISAVQAPNQAIKARIELVANITTINPSNAALFDVISFSQISAPEQPIASPSPTPAQVSPSPKASAVAIVVMPSSTPSPIILPSVLIANDETDSDMVLGINTASNEATIEGLVEAASEVASENGVLENSFLGVSPIFLGLTGGGVILLSTSGYLFFKGFRSGKLDSNAEDS